MQAYIFMEGRVNSFLLCLSDKELQTPSPQAHTRPITRWDFTETPLGNIHGIFLSKLDEMDVNGSKKPA